MTDQEQPTPTPQIAPASTVSAAVESASPALADGRTRAAPFWARWVRHAGEDIVWALQGWNGVPKPAARATFCGAGALASWWLDVDGVAGQLLQILSG